MAETVYLGDHELTFPGTHLGMLQDCNAVLDSAEGLHNQIAEDGYLLARGLIDKDKIMAARRAILEYAEGNGKDEVFKPGTEMMDAIAGTGSPGRTMGAPAVTHHPDVLSVLEGDQLFTFFRNFFEGDTRTFDYKWLRFVRPDGWSGPHCDFVYMGRGSKQLHTCWIPFGDVPAIASSPGRTMGAPAVTHHPDVLSVLEGGQLFTFFRNFFEGDTRTFDYKWLRFVRPDGWSGPHCDFVYMGRGSKQLHTCWIPFGDVPATMGTLTVLVGSHNLESFAPVRDTYGRTDVDKDGTPGHFGRDPMEISEKYGGEWQTADFEMGDVIVFTMHTMHTSTKNLSDRWRISCDIRFQPAEHPIDERWVGKNPISHTGGQKISFEEAKKEWGLE